jgi:hypothetical protein
LIEEWKSPAKMVAALKEQVFELKIICKPVRREDNGSNENWGFYCHFGKLEPKFPITCRVHTSNGGRHRHHRVIIAG